MGQAKVDDSSVKTDRAHTCPFHSASSPSGSGRWSGLAAPHSTAYVTPIWARLSFELCREMTERWQKSDCSLPADLPPRRSQGIIYSDGMSSTSRLSLQGRHPWSFDSCPHAQDCTDPQSYGVWCWRTPPCQPDNIIAKNKVGGCQVVVKGAAVWMWGVPPRSNIKSFDSQLLFTGRQ